MTFLTEKSNLIFFLQERNMEKIKKIAYTGSLAINIRNLKEAVGTFESKNNIPMTTNELSNLLQMLESFVMSSKIYYDGTLPPKDLEQINLLLENLNRLDEFKALKISIAPISFHSKTQTLKIFENSILQAFELIKKIPEETETNSINGDINRFINYFEKNSYTYSDRYNDALKIVSDVLEGKETFRGSKCVAGILIAKDDDVYVYDFVKQLFANAHSDAQKRNLVAKLIDRFRINYISEQASTKSAAYLANPAIEHLRSQQTFLFWRYTMSKVGKNLIAQNNLYNLSETSKQLFETFPVGLSILMNTPGRNPEALFETANLMKDKIFNKIMTSETPKERVIHTFDDEEFQTVQETLFAEKFNKYSSMSKLKRLTLKGSRYILLKGVGSIISNGLDIFSNISEELPLIDLFDNIQIPESVSSFANDYFSDIIGSLTSSQINMIAALNQDKYHDYISKNKRFLLNALDDIENATAISHKVEKMFNRTLIH